MYKEYFNVQTRFFYHVQTEINFIVFFNIFLQCYRILKKCIIHCIFKNVLHYIKYIILHRTKKCLLNN